MSNAAERPRKMRTETYPLAVLTRSFGDASENSFLRWETETTFQRFQKSELEIQRWN